MRLLEGTPWDRPPRCERCDKLESECVCPTPVIESARIPPEKQTARLAIEKRKKGKTVTSIRGLSAEGNDLPALLSRLKDGCGAGGSIAEDVIEIQGDQRERVRQILERIGYRVKS